MKRNPFLGSLVALPLLLAACSSGPARPGAEGGGPGGGRGGRGGGGPVPVLTERVQRASMPVTLPAVGTVEAITSVQIRAQVTGQLQAIHFSEGQDVEKGQPLFSLDPRPFQAALQQAEAVLARDTANLKNAEVQQGRLENLFQRGIVSRDQYDTQRAGAAALAATVEADKAAVENARLNVQYAAIRAPLTGRTGSLNVHVGDLVRANDTTPLVVINQLSPVYVTFSVPGRYLGEIRRYQAERPLTVAAVAPTAGPSGTPPPPGTPYASGTEPASDEAQGGAGTPRAGAGAAPQAGARLQASAGAPAARGRVSFIDNTVDPATGTIRLKGTFPNTGRELWPGAFVQVTLELSTQRDATVVPAVAVQVSQEGQYVYVVKADRTVEMRPVRVERQQGDRMVIAQGVTPGEEVVTDGHLRLVPGARVAERGAEGAGRGAAGQRGERGSQPHAGGGRGL